MGKGEVLDEAVSWTRIVKQGGAGPERTGGHGRGKSGITSWRMLLPALDSSAPALGMKHVGFQPGHGMVSPRFHRSALRDRQPWSHLCFPAGIDLPCVGAQQDEARCQY